MSFDEFFDIRFDLQNYFTKAQLFEKLGIHDSL